MQNEANENAKIVATELSKYNFGQRNDMDIFTKEMNNALMIIGPIRTGKSTIINCLAGHRLESTEEYLLELCNEEQGSKIIHGNKSCTTIPFKYYLEEEKISCIDFAGFGANNSIEQETINFVYSKKCFNYVNNLKFY